MQAAHCSSIKTYLFNNIEGSFSKAIDDPWRKRLWRQKLRFFSTSKGLSLPNYLLSTSYHRVSGEPGPGQGRGSIRMRNCDASAAHWSSSKTHLFNNIEGSFSKATDDPWRERLWRQKLAFFATSKSLPLAKHLLSTSYHTVSGEYGQALVCVYCHQFPTAAHIICLGTTSFSAVGYGCCRGQFCRSQLPDLG